ncbi:hypothetical protein KP509_17G072100 [Ceratopteris richardii]|uniref:Uncharacterized protein n=1 Tax=Ceratopteris richardii TaxID=49495 RepID=A0A8T2SVA2_CERRI|nr:hypothetical protein KP509_17G072100 [Ceratopteris richardii]
MYFTFTFVDSSFLQMEPSVTCMVFLISRNIFIARLSVLFCKQRWHLDWLRECIDYLIDPSLARSIK